MRSVYISIKMKKTGSIDKYIHKCYDICVTKASTLIVKEEF